MRISVGIKLMVLAGISSLILAVIGLYGTWSSWRSILNFQREFKADKAAVLLRHA